MDASVTLRVYFAAPKLIEIAEPDQWTESLKFLVR
jgi:hypothetical protein